MAYLEWMTEIFVLILLPLGLLFAHLKSEKFRRVTNYIMRPKSWGSRQWYSIDYDEHIKDKIKFELHLTNSQKIKQPIVLDYLSIFYGISVFVWGALFFLSISLATAFLGSIEEAIFSKGHIIITSLFLTILKLLIFIMIHTARKQVRIIIMNLLIVDIVIESVSITLIPFSIMDIFSVLFIIGDLFAMYCLWQPKVVSYFNELKK